MSTVSELVTSVRYCLEELTADYYTDIQIKEWLNAAQMDAVKRIPPSELTTLHGSATGTASSISLPTDYVRTISLIVNGGVVPLVMADSPLKDGSRPNSTLDMYGLLSDGTITLPLSAAYELYYIKKPSDISSLADAVVPDIPEVYHYAMVMYAAYEGLKADKYMALADRYHKDYFIELNIGSAE